MLNLYLLRSLCFAVVLIIYNSAFSQSQYDTPLASDPNLRTGKLANGFTYYVRKNTEAKNRALLYLAIKAGSVLEEDNQQGLAHVIEHMGFEGTTHYPKNELINYLQKAGVRFGADVNAYTSFDETVYQLPIPTNDAEILSNGIQIIRDWAQEATLDPLAIEKERSIVLEEKRYRSGVDERMNRKVYPLLYNNSRYGKRLPIGTDDVLNNFKTEPLAKFYHDWYRPDMQAFIAVGDFNVDNMVQTIKDKFGSLKNPANEKDRKIYTIQLIDDHQYAAVTDKEYGTTYAAILVKHPSTVIKTDGDYYNYMIQSVFNICMQNRFHELNKKVNTSFTNASAGIRIYPGNMNAYEASVNTLPENLESSLKTIWRETIRVAKFGFTPDEVTRAGNSFYSAKYYAAQQTDKIASNIYVNEYLQSFLHGGIVQGEQAELKLTQYFLQKINFNLVNRFCNQYISSDNRDVIIKASDKDKDKLPDMQTVESWLNDVNREDITNIPIEVPAKFKSQSLLAKRPEKSKIITEKVINGVNVTEIVLSNGVKIALKPTNFNENEIRFSSVGKGGWSIYNDIDHASALNAASIIALSGLGDLDAQQLTHFLTNNPVNVGPYIDKYTQGVSGSCSMKNIEAALQLTNQYFSKPRKDSVAFKTYIDKLKASAATYRINKDSTKTTNSVNRIDLNRAYAIYKERFANAADFTFIFVGDFEVKQVIPLLERYLGSLPSDVQNTYLPVYKTATATNNLSKITYSGMEPKAKVTLQYNGDYNNNYEANIQFNALTEVLKIRLIERLRQQENGVYSINVSYNLNTIPTSRFDMSISFVCAPVNVEKLIGATLDEINQLETTGPSAINIEKYKAADKLTRETQLKSNSFWLGYLYDQYLNKQNPNDISNYPDILEKITPDILKATALNYLNSTNYHRRVVLPLSAKK